MEWVWPWATVEPQAPPALIFWEQVLKHGEPNAYAAAVVAADTPSLIQTVAHHTFVLASIADGKYRWINRSIAISLLPAILATLAMFFNRVQP